ncbi:hypothetical protein BLNAU_6772 [Blattamonas nauphoetae]|uniref:Uncharacterized protein n=1 Tax=Blattamonas nauphoetae TaxID=2049346 RepID=A0ABQ9Y3F6_9EUKA|nr:hypothetical protein BLNAU_6772 [Blattamonas nauphoetae]
MNWEFTREDGTMAQWDDADITIESPPITRISEQTDYAFLSHPQHSFESVLNDLGPSEPQTHPSFIIPFTQSNVSVPREFQPLPSFSSPTTFLPDPSIVIHTHTFPFRLPPISSPVRYTEPKQKRAQLTGVSVNGSPLVGTNRNSSYVAVNLKSLRVSISDLIIPIEPLAGRVLRQMEQRVVNGDETVMRVMKDMRFVKESFLAIPMEIIRTERFAWKTWTGTEKTYALLPFELDKGLVGGVVLKTTKVPERIPQSFADRILDITGDDDGSSSVEDEQRIEETRSAIPTQTVTVLIEQETPAFQVWSKMLVDRLREHGTLIESENPEKTPDLSSS